MFVSGTACRPCLIVISSKAVMVTRRAHLEERDKRDTRHRQRGFKSPTTKVWVDSYNGITLLSYSSHPGSNPGLTSKFQSRFSLKAKFFLGKKETVDRYHQSAPFLKSGSDSDSPPSLYLGRRCLIQRPGSIVRSSSGKTAVCKTAIREFDSHPHFQIWIG